MSIIVQSYQDLNKVPAQYRQKVARIRNAQVERQKKERQDREAKKSQLDYEKKVVKWATINGYIGRSMCELTRLYNKEHKQNILQQYQ